MNTRHFLSGLLLSVLSCMPAAALAGTPPAAGAKLRQLEVSLGRWVYHGHFLGGKGMHPGVWTWHEDCRWSDNRVFMLCSFSNTWAGRHVNSEVVDTYNPRLHQFWHYEIFDSSTSPGKPFAARMRIDGASRLESWTTTRHGKTVRQRIVYRFESADKVDVRFEQSTDGTHWRTTASGTGEKRGK